MGLKEEHARERNEGKAGCAGLAPTGSWEIRHAFLPTISVQSLQMDG